MLNIDFASTKFALLLSSAVLAIAPVGLGQGDLVLKGHAVGPSGATRPLSSLTPSDMADVLSAAKSIDPSVGAQIEAEVNAGTLGIGEDHLGSKALGTHDDNTIGLSLKNDDTLNGIAVLHEYEHVQAARAAGTPNDKSGGVDPDPCGPLGHGMSTATSADLVCEAASDSSISDSQKAKYCSAYDNLVDTIGAQQDIAKEAGCPVDPPPISAMGCPACS